MPGEAIFSLIRRIKEAGAIRLQVLGGEPLIREDIGEIIDCAKEHGLYVSLSSTGYFPEKISALKNIDMIFLSFDGDEAIHDAHKGKGSYKRLMATIGMLKKLHINFCTTTVLTKINKDSIDFILETARSNNSPAAFQPLYYTPAQYKNHIHLKDVPGKFLLGNEEMRDIIRRLIDAKKGGWPIASSLPYLRYLLRWKDYGRIYSPDKDPRLKCWAGKLHCYIDTNGLLYPCGDSIGVAEGVDCLKAGFGQAFKRVNCNQGCRSCIIGCDLETNLMFSLNAGSITNWLRIANKNVLRKN